VLFDTNVVLDVLLERHPHAPAATLLFEHVARRNLEGLLGATTVTTVHCLAAKAVGPKKARGHIETLLSLFDVAPVTRAVLGDALNLAWPDYEDAVLLEAARNARADGVVTRDAAGFKSSRLRIYAPDELLGLLAATPG
jgi:predicted nucleic acid-binding protein